MSNEHFPQIYIYVNTCDIRVIDIGNEYDCIEVSPSEFLTKG